MNILSVVTSTLHASVALGNEAGIVASARVGRKHRHAEFLTPAISFCLDQADLKIGDVTGVAVDHGPGLFTGLRVGLATVKGLALANGLPVVALSSLDLLAFSVRESPRRIVALLDARRGELYTAHYRGAPGGIERVTEPTRATPEAVEAEIVAFGGEVLLVGAGARVYRDRFERLSEVRFADWAFDHPSAEEACFLAVDRMRREEFASGLDVLPQYLRKSDAELDWGAAP